MNRTKIDWPGLAYSWNPIVGCANGCSYCYAKRISDRFKMIPDFSIPKFFPERLAEPYKVKKPSTIFVGSMCDIFSKGVDEDWVYRIKKVCEECPRHTFMFLTKLPENYNLYWFSRNCILGATAEGKQSQKRMETIQNYRGNNRTFLSIEPIRGVFEGVDLSMFELIIIGADSTPGAPKPPLEWVKSIQHRNIYYKESIRELYPEFQNK